MTWIYEMKRIKKILWEKQTLTEYMYKVNNNRQL